MSISDNLKGKNLIVVGAAAVLLAIVLVVVFLPGSKKTSEGPEVISKRVKINLQEEGPVQTTAAPQTTEVKPEALKPAVKVETPAAAVKGTEKPSTPPIKIALEENKPEEAKKIEAKTAVKETPKEPEAVKKPQKTALAEKKADQKAKPKKTAAAKSSSKGAWAINVASYSNSMDAKNLNQHLKAAGYRSYITEFTKDSVTWYRVRVGFFQTRAEAAKAGKAIKKKFRVQTPWVVKPPRGEAAAAG